MTDQIKKKIGAGIKRTRWKIFYRLHCKIEDEENIEPILE
jgi:hypothetical protein